MIAPGRLLSGDHCWCRPCGLYFNSTHAFDKHRVGEYPARRCLSVAEMLAKGMALNATGWWVTALNTNPDYSRKPVGGDLPRPTTDACPAPMAAVEAAV